MVSIFYFYMNFFAFTFKVKSFTIAYLFLFLFLFPVAVFGRTYKSFFCVYFIIYFTGRCDQDQAFVSGHTGKCFCHDYYNFETSYVRI